jgi:hypothetical protein
MTLSSVEKINFYRLLNKCEKQIKSQEQENLIDTIWLEQVRL